MTMSIQPDSWIREQAHKGMIQPFVEQQIKQEGEEKKISFGTSSYGYDVRCAREFKIFTNIHSAVVDPKKFDLSI